MTTTHRLARLDETTPTVVLSYGLGEDSTAILLRWIKDPTSRDFDLSDLVVITAMTGNEWESTRTAVETHVLPRLAAAGIRYIQVGRARRHVTKAGDGVVVLDDSRTPPSCTSTATTPSGTRWSNPEPSPIRRRQNVFRTRQR
ncbi:hypothetical protein GCM10020255_027350 [Rhodococcus baikonurensis]